MIILIIIICRSLQTAIYEFNANTNTINEWEQNGQFNLNTCGYIQYFGSPNNTYYQISRIFLDLEPHSHIKVDAQFLSIDSINQPSFLIDFEFPNYSFQSSTSAQICDTLAQELVSNISITYKHNRRTVWIYITQQMGGLISLKLSIINCQYECAGCIANYPGICLQWKLHQYSLNKKQITNFDGWTVQSYLTSIYCGNCQFLSFSQIKYQTELPPHQDVLIRFFKLFGNILIVDYLYGKQTISNSYLIEILIENHHDPILQLNIYSQTSSQSSYIRDFEIFYTQTKIMIKRLNIGCLEQIGDKCLNCQEGWIQDEFLENCNPICGDGIIQGQEQCDTLMPNHSCYQCKYSCIENCQICQFGYCIQCNDGFVVNSNFSCDPLCGDDNLTPYSVNSLWDSCFDYKFIQISNCKKNYFSICLDCQEGWIYNQFLESCLPICGDGIIQGQEQCDNLIPNHSCYQCKYSCVENCQICQFGICSQCIEGFEFSLKTKKCMPICHDNIISSFEKCYDYQCQSDYELNCQLCIDGKCQLCKFGWELRDNKCERFCGDGLIAQNSIEQCDDANQIQNDGCYDCQFECIPNCFLCLDNQTCLICQDYFQFDEQLCQPICGDGIILYGFEDCDDGNSEPYDGCYQCKYQCSQGCSECEKGQNCQKCYSQYILNNETAQCQEIKSLEDQNEDKNNDEIQNIMCSKNFILVNYECVNQCGNGILNINYEQCDDGNLIGGDGCSFLCFEEDSYQCQNHIDSISICSYIQPPDFMLYSLSSKTNDTQVIELRFTQKVKLQSDLNFEDIAGVFIIPQTNQVINIKPIVKLSTTFDNPIYQIIVNFRELVKDPVLQINLAQLNIKDQYGLDLKKNETKINLGNPFVLPESTQQKVTQIVLLNDGMIYSMISISGFAFLSGNVIMLFNLLDLLQSLSYITYMQYSFPPHLIQFLNTFTKVSLKPILDYFRIDEILSYLNGGSLPFQSKNSSQNQSNPLNQFYLMNAKSCYFSIIVSLITYQICRLLTSQKIETLQYILFQKFQNSSRYLLIYRLVTNKLQKFCTKFKNEYFSFGVFKVYLAILHQLFFSSLLQFPDYNFNSPLMAFNSINAIIGLMVTAYISIQLLSITSANQKDKQKWLYFYQDSNSEFWASNFRSFQIYRIMFYIFTIVMALNYPQVQSILLSMYSFFYLGYLLKYQPLQSMYEYAKLISREFLFIIISGSFLIYSFDFEQNQLLLYGWIHIALFSLILISNLIIDLIECVTKVWNNYQKKKLLLKQKEIKLFYENPLQNLVLVNINQKK